MTENISTRATQKYSTVEDLAQEPSIISSLEVLQTCPTQWKSLHLAIGGIDAQDSNLEIFHMKKSKPCLSHQLAFQV